MLSILIYIILFGIAVCCYFNNKRGETLLCLVALCSNCFGFVDSSGGSIKATDLVLCFAIFTILHGITRNKRYLQLKNDPIGIVIVLLYFYLRTYKKEDFKKFIKYVLVASVIQGVFYYLQLVGINVLSGRVSEADDVGEITRYANFPSMASFFVVYYVISNKASIIEKMLFICFFGMMYILGQMRGGIMAVTSAIGVFFLLKRKVKYVSYIVVGTIVYQFIVAPMFEYRTRNAQNDTFTEIVNVVKNPTDIYQQFTNGTSEGSFSFRIAMLSERVIFMCHNPQYFPFGVGCIHEESASNNFHFLLGTRNSQSQYGQTMLGSADNSWVGILMHYGITGVMLFILLLSVWIKKGIPQVKNSDDATFITCVVFVVAVILSSFNSDNLNRIPSMLTILFYLTVIYRYNHDKKIHLLFNRLCRESEKRIEPKA